MALLLRSFPGGGGGAARCLGGARRLSSGAAEYLEGLVRVNYEGGTDRRDLGADPDPLGAVKSFLSALDSPQDAYPVVHVVGSKGKGSTSAMLSSILSRSGLRVGTYTSPHVVSLGERVRIDGRACGETDLLDHFRRHESDILGVQERTNWRLSYFEALTGLVLRRFADEEVDLSVVEAGLGGVGDATNVFSPDRLKLVVVTPLELEHTEVLGDDIRDIAAAKVGVVKPGTPLLVAAQSTRALENLVAAEGHEAGCGEIIRTNEACAVGYREEGEGLERDYVFAVRDNGARRVTEVRGVVAPRFVIENFSTALVAARLVARDLGMDLTEDAIAGALQDHRLPGRFEIILDGSEGDGEAVVVLDGAHTPQSAKVLSATLEDLFPSRGRSLVLVVAMATDKDAASYFRALALCAPETVVCTRVSTHEGRSGDPADLAKAARGAGLRALEAESFDEARSLAKALAKEAVKKAIVCYTGSFKTVAAARAPTIVDDL